MRVLVLGGTQFVGRHIVEAMLAGGHSVSILNRGRTPDEVVASVQRLRGDRDDGAAGLDALRGHQWDACVDVSGYMPRQVLPSVELLSAYVRRYVFVSAVSVYGDPLYGPVTEDYPRQRSASTHVTEIDQQTYGPLKVACENFVQHVFGDRCTILRPQIVVGPYEPGSRFTYWARRSMQCGEMLAPGDGSDYLQVIDARDLAAFTHTVVEGDIGGIFNLAGSRLTWTHFMDILRPSNLVWVTAAVLRSAGVSESELPLYRCAGAPRSNLMHVSNARAIAAGLKLTDLELTVQDTRRWLAGRETTPALSPQREAELIKIACGA